MGEGRTRGEDLTPRWCPRWRLGKQGTPRGSADAFEKALGSLTGIEDAFGLMVLFLNLTCSMRPSKVASWLSSASN